MFLIWGFRTRTKILARLLLVCHACSKPASQAVAQRVRWFTLFFIPLIPFNRKHLMQCAMCGHVSQVTKEDAARLVQSATEPATPAAPSALEPSPAVN